MPQESDRLKLPLPLGNETVSRESLNSIFEKIDAGVATQADLDALREAVSKMDIPDASLTQKGKVQLSNATESTTQTLAATSKAVNDARQEAILAAATDATAKANTAENNAKGYADGGFIKKAIIIPASANLNNYTTEGQFYCPANVTVATLANCPVLDAFNLSIGVHAGVVQTLTTFDPNNLQTYQRNYYNGTWGTWVKVPSRAEFDTVQKVRVTNDAGFALDISNANLNDPRKTGWYMGSNVTNAPTGEWHYVEIIRHNDLWEVQKAYNFNSTTFQQRAKRNGQWSGWSPDLFQSVSNGKASIAAAITGKGLVASGSETFSSLATKISQISSDLKTISGNTSISVSNEQGYNGKEVTSTILDFIPQVVTVNLETSYRNSNSYDSGSFKAGTSLKFDSRTNTFPSSWISSEGLWGGSGAKFSFSISVTWNTTSRTLRISISDGVGYNPKYITVNWSVYGL